MEKSVVVTATFKNFNESRFITIDNSRYFIHGLKINQKNVISIKDIFLPVILNENSGKISNLYFLKQAPVNISNGKAEIDLSVSDSSKLFEVSKPSKIIDIFEDFLSFCRNFLDDDSHSLVACDSNLMKDWDIKKYSIIKEEMDKIFKSSFIENSAFKEVFNTANIPMDILSRHFLVVGETGSGKTYSVLFPVIESLKNKIGSYSALIIDPKMNELKNKFIDTLPDKVKKKYLVDILSISNKGIKLDIFEGLRHEQLEKRIEFLFKFSPKFHEQSKNTPDSYWANSSRAYVKSLIMIDGKIRERKKEKDIFSFFDGVVKKITRLCLRNSIQFPKTLLRNNFSKVKGTYFYKLKALSRWLAKMHMTFRDCNNDVLEFVQEELFKNNLPQIEFFGEAPVDTFTSITSVAETLFEDWTDRIIDSVLWSDPFETLKNNLSIEEVILNKKILIFSMPSNNISEHYYRLGKIIKNKFFSFCFKTYEHRQVDNIPVFYIADEFHRFITGDEESGEQSFLDRCRGYNVSCIMATQSISSLKYGINENTGFSDKNLDNSVEIVLNNCCTKFFFRTTDTETNLKLKSIIHSVPYPEFSNYGHVIDVFPVSSLNTGECYYITSKGKWGRNKINVKSQEPKTLEKVKVKRRAA